MMTAIEQERLDKAEAALANKVRHITELEQRLATAEASAAAVGAQVREAIAVALEDAEYGPDVLSRVRSVPLPSGAEALAARDRATAERHERPPEGGVRCTTR